jgi:hypothetical protein
MMHPPGQNVWGVIVCWQRKVGSRRPINKQNKQYWGVWDGGGTPEADYIIIIIIIILGCVWDGGGIPEADYIIII